MFTINNLISDLNRKVSPGNISQSKDIFGAIHDGIRNFLEIVQPKELSRRILIDNALYDQINMYTCPEDLDEKKIMQWYQLGDGINGMSNTDTLQYPMTQVTNRKFDNVRTRKFNEFTIEWQSGVKFIKSTDFGIHSGGLTIHSMNALNDNGTWNTFGNVENLVEDHLQYITGNGSLRFDFNNSATTGGIENFTLTPVDISQYFTVGTVFTWLQIPNVDQIQSVTLDLKSSNSDYYSILITKPFNSPYFQVGSNMIGFKLDESVMNTIGTPNSKNINHIKFTFVTNGTLNMKNVRMDNIVARAGSAFGIQYLSKYILEEIDTKLWIDRPTQTSNLIHLENGAYQCLLNECAVIVAQEIFTDTQSNALALLEKRRVDGYKAYKKENKTEYIDEQQQYRNYGVEYGYQTNYPYRNHGNRNEN